MAVLAFIKQHISTANASTYTFSSTSTGGANDIGATASDRRVIVGGNIAATTSATRNINTITFGGVAADRLLQITGTRSAGTMRSGAVCVAHAGVSTATSISIVLTATTTVANAAVSVWSATEASSTAATEGTVSWATASAATMGIFPVNGGGFFLAQHWSLSTASSVWTNATAEHDTPVENSGHTGGDGTVSATVGVTRSDGGTSFRAAIWMTFDSTTATAAAELYRKFTAFPGTLVGRRTLRALPKPVYEWREIRP